MQFRFPRGRPHRAAAWALAFTAGAVLAVGVSPGAVKSAAAHSELIASEPTAGAELTSAPQVAALSFASPIEPSFASAAVSIGAAQPQEVAARVEDGSRLIAELPPAARSGAGTGQIVWTVSYRVVALDGHPIDGQVSFSVQGASAPSGTAPLSPSMPGDVARPDAPAPPPPPAPAANSGKAVAAVEPPGRIGDPSAGLWRPITTLSLLSVTLVAVVVLTGRLRRSARQ